MIVNVEFTPAQETIIKEVCDIRIKSLMRIYEAKPDEDIELILANFGLTKRDFDEECYQVTHNMEELMENPKKFFHLNKYDMCIFRHILYNFEPHWKDRYPVALGNLWNKIWQYDNINRMTTPN